MKTIKTKSYKLAYTSYDDQPNFVNRDQKNQGSAILTDTLPSSEAEIVARWQKKRKKQKVEQMPQGSI